MMNHEDVHSFAKERGILRVELCWIDLDQRWHTMTLPYTHDLIKSLNTTGSVWPASDLPNSEQFVWVPDWDSTWSCPFSAIPTLSILGFLSRAAISGSHGHFEDVRSCAKRAEERLLTSRAFKQAEFSFSGSFFLLQKDGVRGGSSSYSSSFDPRDWIPVSDSYLKDFESEWGLLLERCGMGLRSWHLMKETGRVGFETGFRSLTDAADHWAILRRFAKSTAEQHGRLACFLPMPWRGQPGAEVTVSMKADADVRLAWAANMSAIVPFAIPTSNSFRRFCWRLEHGWDSLEASSFVLSNSYESDPTIQNDSMVSPVETLLRLADGSISAHLLLAALAQTALLKPENSDLLNDVVLPTSLESAWAKEENVNLLTLKGVFLKESLSLYKEKRLKELKMIQLTPHLEEWVFDI